MLLAAGFKVTTDTVNFCRDGFISRALFLHQEKPDLWIEPCNSVIVQIKAAEILASERYGVCTDQPYSDTPPVCLYRYVY